MLVALAVTIAISDGLHRLLERLPMPGRDVPHPGIGLTGR
jgi:hypothetical protein